MGAIAAAIIIRKERDLVAQFRQAGALAPAQARSLSQLGVDEDGVAWRRLTRRAVIREAAPATYYLDEPSWNALRYIRRRLAFVIIAVALVTLVGGLLLITK